MIVVTGTKRSGTSLWMQLLSEAGYRFIGDRFPRNWAETLKVANPNGFYESELRRGIYHETNPHPRTGRYLPPEPTRELLVKVFVPGLVKSDVAFLHRTIASIRPWRDVTRSVRRMRHVEAEVFGWADNEVQPAYLPPEVEWLRENFLLVRDLRLRAYPHRVVPHLHLMTDPGRVLTAVLGFLDGPVERAPALAGQIDVGLHRHRGADEEPSVFTPRVVDHVDTWMAAVDDGRWDDREALSALEAAWKEAVAADWFRQKYRWDDPRVAGPPPG